MERSSTTLSLVALQILRRTTVIRFLCCDDHIIALSDRFIAQKNLSQMPLLVGSLVLLLDDNQPGADDLLAAHQLGLEVQPDDAVCRQQSHLSQHDEKET